MVYVATSDGALSSIVRGNGAFVISTKAFCDEMRKASQGEREILEEMAIAARWNASKKISRVGVKDDDVKRKLMEMYKTAPSMETPANAPKGDFKKGKGNTVTWTAVVTGTHTGKPFSPLPKVPAVKPNKKTPKALQNDAETITAYFDKSGEVITKFTVAAIPGGRGFSGPVGFYLQMGGDPKKLPKL